MKIVWSILPKFYQHLDVDGLAALIHEVGLDTTNMMIRKGYWVTGEDLAAETKAFVGAMAAAGLKVAFATAGYTAEQLRQDDTPLAILADNGIGEFRMDYFGMGYDGDDVRGEWAKARVEMESMAEICRKRNMRAVFQIHHGTLVTCSAAVWPLVKDLPPANIGVMLDPGNQSFEGHENWHNAAVLLGEYLVAMGVKDSAPSRDLAAASEPANGWDRKFSTIYDGTTNWHEVIGALNDIDFEGTFVFMPFYGDDENATAVEKLKTEVAYLRAVVAGGGAGE